MKVNLTEKQVAEFAEKLGYVGDHALRTSGNPDEDELAMVILEMEQKGCSCEDAINEIVRTRKYREQS